MQNVTHVLTNEQSELRANTAEASRRRMNARANIGLDQVDNTSDADKPISSATQDALDSKMDVDNGTYLKSAEVSGNGYTLTIRPNNGDVIEFQGGGIVETVQADWAENSQSDPSFIKNKPDLSIYAQAADLSSVATSGSYNDLNDKPDLSGYAVKSEMSVTAGSGADADKTTIQLKSGTSATVLTTHQDVTGKADKVAHATGGNLASLDSSGNLADSGVASTNLVHDGSYVHTDNNFSNADKTKLDGIDSGAEANVQSDWDQTDDTADDFIKNKPSIPSFSQTQMDAINSGITSAKVNGYDGHLSNTDVHVTTSDKTAWNAKYDKPSGGIPKTDLAEAVQTSLGKADTALQEHQDISGKADKSEMSVVAGTGTDADKTTITLKSGTSATVLTSHQDISGKQDVISDLSDIRSGAEAGATAVQPGDLAAVATSGDYEDLDNKPTIPAAQVNSDWNASSGVAQILNKPSLATVATSGDYDDLTNKPTIHDAQVNSDWNAASGVAQILNKPTLASVATSGSYNDLSNKPTIPAAQVNADWNAVSGVAQILNKPTLSAVATSGAYSDLTGTPTVDQSYGASSTNAQSGTAVASAISDKADKVSSATNGNFAGLDSSGNITDSGSKAGDFATSAQGTKADSAIQSVKVNGAALTPDANKAVDITVPAAQVTSDWNSSSGLSEILHKPDLSVYALKSEM